MMKISKEVASLEYEAIANDALKDEDNGVWLANLPKNIQSVWVQRFYWIRWVDRLAEQDQLVQPGGQQFPEFYQAWQRLRQQKCLAPADHVWGVLRQIESCWYQGNVCDLHQSEIEAWDCYIEAMVDYHQPSLMVATLETYEVMLERLAGACFQLLPFLEDHQRAIARKFGIIDQFYNNLRDIYEDACQGICYFPTVLLDRFGITRQEILDLSCFKNPGYRQLMEFWVETYLPQLRQQNLALIWMKDLHPAWQCLTAWFVHRYMRIERVMQACQYNFVVFAQQYRQVVQLELEQLRNKAHLTGLPCQMFTPTSEMALFLDRCRTVSTPTQPYHPLQYYLRASLTRSFG